VVSELDIVGRRFQCIDVSMLVAASDSHDSGVICSERVVIRGKRAHSGDATGGGEVCHGALELGIGK
jgi:hypothetical protein